MTETGSADKLSVMEHHELVATAVVFYIFLGAVCLGTLLFLAIAHWVIDPQDRELRGK